MSVFASGRERRLWWWALAVVVAIWSTLGLARTVAGGLRARGLLDATFTTAFLMVIAAAVALAWRARPGGLEIGVGLGVVAVYVMVLVRMALPEERTHLIEYGVVALLVHEALSERAACGRRVPVPAVLAVLATAALGALDEVVQLFWPGRVFDPVDMGFNALAAVMAVGGRTALALARRHARRPSGRPGSAGPPPARR